MLIHIIAHGGVQTHVRESALKDEWEKNPLPHQGNRTCVSSMLVWRSTNWATSPSPTLQHQLSLAVKWATNILAPQLAWILGNNHCRWVTTQMWTPTTNVKAIRFRNTNSCWWSPRKGSKENESVYTFSTQLNKNCQCERKAWNSCANTQFLLLLITKSCLVNWPHQQ